jgi:hypothetical protein
MNRNKKSVVLDLRREDGMEALRQLVATADIFITNQPPDVQRKLRLDHDTLAEGRDDLIGVSITGFGMTGARRRIYLLRPDRGGLFGHHGPHRSAGRGGAEDRRAGGRHAGRAGCGDGDHGGPV